MNRIDGELGGAPRTRLLRHFLAALAYRTQKAIRGAPEHYADFEAGKGVRTPAEILAHMTALLGYVRMRLDGTQRPTAPDPPPPFDEEVERFHRELGRIAECLDAGPELSPATVERLLQGPLSDAMTHVGQLAMLRRLADAPIAPESYFDADIRADRLGPDQPVRTREREEEG